MSFHIHHIYYFYYLGERGHRYGRMVWTTILSLLDYLSGGIFFSGFS